MRDRKTACLWLWATSWSDESRCSDWRLSSSRSASTTLVGRATSGGIHAPSSDDRTLTCSHLARSLDSPNIERLAGVSCRCVVLMVFPRLLCCHAIHSSWSLKWIMQAALGQFQDFSDVASSHLNLEAQHSSIFSQTLVDWDLHWTVSDQIFLSSCWMSCLLTSGHLCALGLVYALRGCWRHLDSWQVLHQLSLSIPS